MSSLRSVFTSVLLFAGAAAAQNCTDNQYSVWLVDQNGTPVPVVAGRPAFPTEQAYLAFDTALPSGSYYVHVTDQIGGPDEVRSANDPNDRVVNVVNNAGVITLSLPFSSNPHPAFGLGLNGVGQSVPLGPFHSTTEGPCIFKAWYGDAWDLSLGPTWPYLILGGFDATLGRCRVRSYQQFTIGNGNGSSLAGSVFNDTNNNGARDPGETGAAGIIISLLGGPSTVTTVSDGNGAWSFTGLPAGTYTVEAGVPTGTTATTPTSRTIVVCGCGPAGGADFGLATLLTPPGGCQGRTIGFWGNKNGGKIIDDNHLLLLLPALHLVDAQGHYVSFATHAAFDKWLHDATATNMAYMLSAQLVAMTFNTAGGFASQDCRICDSILGPITIHDLMQLAVASLAAHPYTPSGSTWRAGQEVIKNALDAANNNQNWYGGANCH